MSTSAPENIRNIVLTGHAGAGKTTLIEALLAAAGVIGAPGSIEKGSTASDFDPLEQRFHHSLNPSLLGFDYARRRLNLIDTPGYPDFLGTTLSVFDAADLIAIVINAQAGIEPMTRELVRRARTLHLPCMIVVNKIDAEPDKLALLMQEIGTTFGKGCIALDLPAQHAAQVVDVLNGKDGEADFDSVEHAHTVLLDQIVEVDEVVMERYLEEGDVDAQTLHAPFEKALRENHLIPVVFVSARAGTGVKELLKVFTELAPNPQEAGGHPFRSADGDEFRPQADPKQPLLAHVFRVEFDPYIGKLGMLRMHQGTLRRGDQILLDGGISQRVTHLYRVFGKQHHEISAAGPGEICAIGKLDELHPGSVLHADNSQLRLKPRRIELPEPLVGAALVPHSRADEQKLSDALARLVAEDPGLRVEHDRDANEAVLRSFGEFHLKVTLEKLASRYNVRVDTHPHSVPYRETVTRRAEGHHRHKKQTGGAGQFGEVFLTVEALPRDAGFEFVDQVKGGVIPAQFIPAVEKGVRQAMQQGVLAGYPVQDVRVTVTDGKHHSVDSKEIAFLIAGRKAFQDAAAKAGAVLLEPIVTVEVTAPTDRVGNITGDLAARRARINGSDMAGADTMRITAEVPLAEIEGYASRLNTLTGGAGTWTMAFNRYDTVPPPVQKTLTEQYRAKVKQA